MRHSWNGLGRLLVVKMQLKRLALAIASPKVGVPLAMGLLLLAAPFTYRNFQLANLPDIGDPFDVEAFLAMKLPDEKNAYVEYQDAVAMLSPMPSLEWRERAKIEMKGWAAAPEDIRRWVLANRQAAQKWLEGTRKPDSMRYPPAHPYEYFTPRAAEFYPLTYLACLEGSRLTEEGDAAAAWEWHRGAYRYSRHFGSHGVTSSRGPAAVVHAVAALGIARWSSCDIVDSPMLRNAMDELASDYEMTPPLEESLRWDYIIAREVVHSFHSQLSASTLQRWLRGEPELQFRILQHSFAARLDEHAAQGVGPNRYVAPAELESLVEPLNEQIVTNPGRLMLDQSLLRQWADSEDALHGALMVVLAAQLHARERGELPATAGALLGDHLQVMPVDPFSPTGAPLKYRRDPDGGAVVWSVGKDRVGQSGDVEDAEHHLKRDLGIRFQPPHHSSP